MKSKILIWLVPVLLLLVGVGTGINATTPYDWPCHSAGDLIPCFHLLHPAGDVVPCTHYCTNAYGYTVFCHPAGDIAPCVHRAHLAGDVVPCTHICY